MFERERNLIDVSIRSCVEEDGDEDDDTRRQRRETKGEFIGNPSELDLRWINHRFVYLYLWTSFLAPFSVARPSPLLSSRRANAHLQHALFSTPMSPATSCLAIFLVVCPRSSSPEQITFHVTVHIYVCYRAMHLSTCISDGTSVKYHFDPPHILTNAGQRSNSITLWFALPSQPSHSPSPPLPFATTG
jgi:hypothetical protein